MTEWNTFSKKSFKRNGDRYLHRRVTLYPVGANGAAVATAQVSTPPGRLVGLAVDHTTQPATTDIVIKADTADGATIFTAASSNTDIVARPVGTVAVDETGAATAATDGFAGGFPVEGGVYIDVAQGDAGASKFIDVDLWFRLCRYEYLRLSADSGADGVAVIARTLDLQGAGVLAALAIDFQNMPGTTDVTIRADSSSGQVLYNVDDSVTDVPVSLLGRPALGEDNAASAATDGTEGGNFFKRGLYVAVTHADAFTSSNELILVKFWIDQ
jgi:hypothetical protein